MTYIILTLIVLAVIISLYSFTKKKTQANGLGEDILKVFSELKPVLASIGGALVAFGAVAFTGEDLSTLLSDLEGIVGVIALFVGVVSTFIANITKIFKPENPQLPEIKLW